jgi:hypothetical protein
MKKARPSRKKTGPTARKNALARRKDEEFGREMERMARDPQFRRVTAQILKEFRCTDGDGLEGFPYTEDPTPPPPRARRGRPSAP